MTSNSCKYLNKCGWFNQKDSASVPAIYRLDRSLPVLLTGAYREMCVHGPLGEHKSCPEYQRINDDEMISSENDLGLSEELPGIDGMVNGITIEDNSGGNLAEF